MVPFDVVVMVRARYPAQSSPEIAAKISNEVAWELNGKTAEGRYGLHAKLTGNNYQGVAIDIVADRQEQILFDVLRDAENVAEPQWYRVPGVPVWTPVRLDWLSGTPPPPPPSPTDLEARVERIEQTLASLSDALRGW